MEIKVTITGADQLAQALAKAPAIVNRRLKIAMEAATRDIAEHARANHRFISRSGKLEGSIEDRMTRDGLTVVGEVWLNPAETMTKSGLSYGVFQHEGTKDHRVAPTDRKALRWVGRDGRFWYSKGHVVKGIRPDPFIYNAGEAVQRDGLLQAIFDRQIELALKEAGV